jgi:4-amino-4-deoxy-L-arabinose transferase-like glycosyltransferase
LAWLQRPPVAELLVMAIAAACRLWRLDYHSFWFDEAVSLDWAGSSAGFIWESTLPLIKDKHPPVYYLLLMSWRALLDAVGLGNNDGAIRLLGALLGIATAGGVLLLVRRLSGRKTALLAALLVGLSPALVWYAQELRMFQPAATFLIWALYALLRAWDAPGRRRWGWWAGMAALLLAALYSYLFSAFLLPAVGLALLVLLVEALHQNDEPARAWRRFAEGCGALALTALLFLPLARTAWGVNDSEGAPGVPFADFLATLLHQVQIATIWRTAETPGWLAPAVTAAGLLALAGILLPSRIQPGWRDRLWLLLGIAIPLAIGGYLQGSSGSIFKEDRYFLFVTPFILWAMARGTMVLGEWLPGGSLAAGVAIVALTAAGLPRLWTPAAARENWREAAAYVAAYQRASPGLSAALLAHVDYTATALNWYLDPVLPVDQLPLFYPFGSALTPESAGDLVGPPLDGIAATGAATLWLTQSHLEGVDDSHVVEAMLGGRHAIITEQYPAGVKLTGYALQSWFDALPPLAETAVRPQAELAPGVVLAACEILTPRLSATDDFLHPPSGWVHVRLWWQAAGPVTADYMATVQMVGPEGVWGDRLYRDNEALRRWPSSAWQPGPYLRDEVDVNLNPVTPPGRYPVVVGLRAADGTEAVGKAVCGEVEIVR